MQLEKDKKASSLIKDDSSSDKATLSKQRKLVYYNCRELGHSAWECPLKLTPEGAKVLDVQRAAALGGQADRNEAVSDMFSHASFISKNSARMLVEGYRDTGAEVSLIGDNVQSPNFKMPLLKRVYVKSVNGKVTRLNLVKVEVLAEAGIFNGTITFGV